jgi:hypothetical protein
MINIDLAKALPPRFWGVLTAFLPGLFFEISVVIGNPELIQRVKTPTELDRVSLTIIALVIAFIVGNALMLWVRFLQRAFELLYRLARSTWVKFLEYLLRAKGSPPRLSWFASSRFVNNAYRKVHDSDLEGVQRAWRKAAAQLLSRRYGIEPPSPAHSNEWDAWSSALGNPSPEDFRGLLLIMATHATGWSGLAAAYFGPALRTHFYFAFCLFMIGYGILHDVEVAKWWNDPKYTWAIALRAVLADIPQPRTSKDDQDNA